jgi:hypothetical protein
VFPDSIKDSQEKALPLLSAGSVPFCGPVLSASLWVSMHNNAQSKQQIREVLEGERTIVTLGMRWLLFVILAA